MRLHRLATSSSLAVMKRIGCELAPVFGCPRSEKSTVCGNYILVAEVHKSLEEVSTQKSPWSFRTQDNRYGLLIRLQRVRRGASSPWIRSGCGPKPGVVFAALMVIATVLAFSALFESRNSQPIGEAKHWPDDGYIRYPTSDSEGPKHQSRIYYHNASDWSRNDPHDNGEWRIRMDDQSLIPSEAWDEDEDKYQQWYHARYPEMEDVIRPRKFLRPS